MRRTSATLRIAATGGVGATVLLLAGGVGTGIAVAAPAPTGVCDAYSHSCHQQPTAQIGPAAPAPADATTNSASSLPFTGGELVLMSTAGLIAIGGGTVFVAATRRRHRGTSA